MKTTRLLKSINECGIFPQYWDTPEKVNQQVIDDIQDKILAQLSPEDIAEHNCFAYSNSVKEYDSKPVNMKVVPELPVFMDLIPNDGLILDLGAGHLRDTLYMINTKVRDSLNREGVDSPDLEKRLRVIPLEKSSEFLDSCFHKISKNLEQVPLVVKGDFMSPGTGMSYNSRDKELEKIFTEGKFKPVLDGIWSCAAYMIHTTPDKLEESTRGWAKTLKKGGIFAVSYINKKEGQKDIKLLASRSAPGEIKIFSHFTPKEVDRAFENAGLKLIDSSTGDYTGHGHVMSKFFGNAMYGKE